MNRRTKLLLTPSSYFVGAGESEKMLKGSCNMADKIQSLTGFRAWPSPDLHRSRNAVVSCSFTPRRSSDLAVSVSSQAPAIEVSPMQKPDGGSLADRLRLGNLTEDGLSYKESFIIRSYEVGIKKTASVETIDDLLQI